MPKLDQKSFWRDSRLVTLYKIKVTSASSYPHYIIEMCLLFLNSNFSEIFDVDWFVSFLSKDVKIIHQLPKRGGKTWNTHSMRVPRKCSERCYQTRVLPVLLKRHVSSLFSTTHLIMQNAYVGNSVQWSVTAHSCAFSMSQVYINF